MPIKLGQPAEHGFDQPLGLMSDCHRRIEHFLAVLLKVTDEAGEGALTDEQRRAVEAALTYFRTAAPRHTQDEEQSLFPSLRAANQPELRAALEAVAALEHDHARADQWHAAVDAHYRRWLDSGSLAAARRVQLAELLAALRDLYRLHIDVEDRQIFPLAQRLLSEDELYRIGNEMAERRGLVRHPR